MVYFVQYRVVSFKSDGALLGEILSGASKNAASFDSEDLQFLSEVEAKGLVDGFTFVGNRLKWAEHTTQTTPTAVTPASAQPMRQP